MAYGLSEQEASSILRELKDSLVDEYAMPGGGEHNKGFETIGRVSEEKFRIDLYRGGKDFSKHSVSARTVEGGVVLMRLCVGRQPHRNPDGQIIVGNHLHIYRSGFGDRYAEPVNIASPDFIDDTVRLLERFNVVKKPVFSDGLIP